MSDRPNAQDLLNIAREELMKRLLPELPSSLRYEALMIANAMAIAAREVESGRSSDERELKGLMQLLDQQRLDDVGSTTPSDKLLDDYRKRLCTEIRAGRFDERAAQQRALMQHLEQTAKDKLAISNPKLLPKSSQ